MINLLPPEDKQAILYARRNTKLAHWLTVIVLAIAGVVAIVAFGQLYLAGSINSHEAQVSEVRQQLKAQKLDETQKRVTDISNSFKLVSQVLSKQILFSKMLRQIGSAIPSGAVLTDLNISKVQGGIDLTFAAKDYQTGTQVQLNMSDNTNKIFEQSDLKEIRCTSEPTQVNPYPCQVTIRALFGSNSPYLFINNEVVTR